MSTARFLQKLGQDVIRVAQLGLARAADEELLHTAHAQQRIMVTRYRDLGQQWLRCLDRTNWTFGTMDINILVMAVAYKGVAVPFLWVFLDKRGHSNSYERIGILKHVRWNKKKWMS